MPLQRRDDLRVGVLGVVDVGFEVAADGDGGERDARDLDERTRRQLDLAQRAMPEVEIRSDLHQLRPIGARA